LGIRILTANSGKRWRESLMGSHRMGDGPIFLKISAPHPFNDGLSIFKCILNEHMCLD
jgi:hypothetical protein